MTGGRDDEAEGRAERPAGTSARIAQDDMFSVERTLRPVDARTVEELVARILGEIPVEPFDDVLRADYEVVVAAMLDEYGLPAPHDRLILDDDGVGWARWEDHHDCDDGQDGLRFQLKAACNRACVGIEYLSLNTKPLTPP